MTGNQVMRAEALLICERVSENDTWEIALHHVGIDRFVSDTFPLRAAFWLFAIVRRETHDTSSGINLSVRVLDEVGDTFMESPFPYKEFDRNRMWIRQEHGLLIRRPERFIIQVCRIQEDMDREVLAWVPLDFESKDGG